MLNDLRWRFVLGVCIAMAEQGCASGHAAKTSAKTWLEINGIVDVFKDDALAARFVDVYELVGDEPYGPSRAGDFGFGVLAASQSFKPGAGETRHFFAVGDYGDRFVFYESPLGEGGELLVGQ